MSARRVPVIPPAKMATALASSQASQQTAVLDGITLYPPSETRATWRVKFHLAGRAHELSGGTTVETAWATYLAAKDMRGQQSRAAQGLPELGGTTVSEMLATYMREGGKSARWKQRTRDDRRRDFSCLQELGKTLQAMDLNASHLRDYVSSAGTSGRADHLLNVTGTFLRWGWKRGYLTREQAQLADEVTWRPPVGYKPEHRGTRRQQGKAFALTASGTPGGEVPTHQQVDGLAKQVQTRNALGSGLIHTAANLGLRCSELLLLTASSDVANAGKGNFVDTAKSEVRVRVQVNGGSGGVALPKGTKIRDVVIPPVGQVGTGFDLRAWLKMRCQQALVEQRQGTNDLALIFPSPTGKVWNYSNLNNRVLTPSFDAMGWAMPSYETAHGRKLTLRRFTLHSLRDRFATTAINEWGYKEEQLLEQGSWTDAETVRRYYAGTTDDTHSSVRSLHGLS